MSLRTTSVSPAEALDALAGEIAAAKGDDRLEPVAVVVPTNTCGVMARRALGRRGGVVGIDVVTLNRLAELLAGPALAAAGRAPISAPVVDLAVTAALAADAGSFADVAEHPSTVVALRELHGELRLAGDESVAALSRSSRRGAEAARVSAAVAARLRGDWYDEADLYAGAIDAVRHGVPAGLRHVVVHLPQDLTGRPLAFVRALAESIDVRVLIERRPDGGTEPGAPGVAGVLDVVDDIDDEWGVVDPAGSVRGVSGQTGPIQIVSTTDADDEVRIATRAVVDAARAGTPLERIAVLWPTHEPYARLVEHHLSAAAIRWNGRPGTTLAERLVCRLVLDLLELDHRGLRRRDLFDLLADVPARGADGNYLPSASWERLSREAGVARDGDWVPRLGAYLDHERWGADARSLSAFVDELRSSLGHPGQTRRWWDWAEWCGTQLDRWIGRARLERLPEPEYRAWESLTTALDRLRHLDAIGEPVTRHRFRATLAAELDALPPREGRIGDGVTIGPLEGAVGLDIDVAVVLGAAEGTMPPVPRSDPLVSDADRRAAGLTGPDARAARLHRRLLAVQATAATTVTVPRGDLRATATREPSRWIMPWFAGAVRAVESHTAGLTDTAFPASPSEYRLRTRYGHVHAGGAVGEAAGTSDDIVLQRGLRLLAARRDDRFTEFDGNLSSVAVPALDHAVSPSQLERWTACPHAYFMRYLLRVEPVEEPGAEISITALERGSLHHDALDRFHRAVIAGELPQPTEHGWTDVHRAALARLFAEVCARSEQRGRTGRPAYWADEQRRMEADALEWLDHDGARSRARGATVIGSEHEFRADDGVRLLLPGGRAIAVRGKIDRIDRAADGSIVVTDHKSGANKYKDLDVDDPTLGATAFQLPSYAAAARVMVGEPDAPVLAEYGLFAKGKYERPGYLLTDEVWRRVGHAADVVVRGIESGYFPNRPARPGFHLYVECEYCEPDALGTAERWSEWQRKRHDPAIAPWFASDDLLDLGGTHADPAHDPTRDATHDGLHLAPDVDGRP